jgi:gliding motility-associated-like protein
MIKYIYIYIILNVALITNAQDLTVSFTKTEKECVLAEASVTASTTSLPIQYLWSNGAITNNVSELQPGEYSVKVTADNGKDTTIYFNIEELICEPTPETHFTPNSDGFNDTWSIGRINNFPDFDLFVYNRWGQQVHHQSLTYIPWDGRSLGLPLPDATYYYILFFSKTDKNKFIKGPISIIR